MDDRKIGLDTFKASETEMDYQRVLNSKLSDMQQSFPIQLPLESNFRCFFVASDQTQISNPLLFSVIHHHSDLCLIPGAGGEEKRSGWDKVILYS